METCCCTTNRMPRESLDIKVTKAPVAKAGMLIRRPVTEVFAAFVDPEITTKFWFTKSSGKLVVGRRIRWEWEMYGAATELEVKELEPSKHILIRWGLAESPTTVEWIFTPRGKEATFVSITNSGFSGDGDSVLERALGSAAGFELVLAGLKAYLEFGIQLNLIADRFPDQIIGTNTENMSVSKGAE